MSELIIHHFKDTTKFQESWDLRLEVISEELLKKTEAYLMALLDGEYNKYTNGDISRGYPDALWWLLFDWTPNMYNLIRTALWNVLLKIDFSQEENWKKCGTLLQVCSPEIYPILHHNIANTILPVVGITRIADFAGSIPWIRGLQLLESLLTKIKEEARYYLVPYTITRIFDWHIYNYPYVEVTKSAITQILIDSIDILNSDMTSRDTLCGIFDSYLDAMGEDSLSDDHKQMLISKGLWFLVSIYEEACKE